MYRGIVIAPRARWLLGVLLAFILATACGARAQTVLSAFEGTSQLDNCALGNCFRPPDTMGAIGTTQFFETTNGSITVYDRNTGAVQSRQDYNTFWQNAGAPAVGGVYANGDQRVLFDHYTNRWLAVGFGGSVANINIAVSDTANALGTWRGTTFTGFAGGTADYPTLGMDDKGVYIGTNNFTGPLQSVSLFTIPKADLFGGAPSTTNMTTFTTPLAVPQANERGFAIQGAVNWGGNPTSTANILAVSLFQFDVLSYQLNGVDAAGATQGATRFLGLAPYTNPLDARQPDGTRLVDTLDDRISANVYQANGKVYGVHTITTGAFSQLQWFVTDAATGALLAQGIIGAPGYDFYQGAIAANEFGEVVISYNRSGAINTDGNGDGKPDGNISIFAQVYRDFGDGTLVAQGTPELLRVSEVSDYRCGSRLSIDTSCRQRWGDYAAVTIDPLDHHNFWTIGEYADEWAIIPGFSTTERAIWHTFIAQIGAAEVDVPEPASLALLLAGLGALTGLRRVQPRRNRGPGAPCHNN